MSFFKIEDLHKITGQTGKTEIVGNQAYSREDKYSSEDKHSSLRKPSLNRSNTVPGGDLNGTMNRKLTKRGSLNDLETVGQMPTKDTQIEATAEMVLPIYGPLGNITTQRGRMNSNLSKKQMHNKTTHNVMESSVHNVVHSAKQRLLGMTRADHNHYYHTKSRLTNKKPSSIQLSDILFLDISSDVPRGRSSSFDHKNSKNLSKQRQHSGQPLMPHWNLSFQHKTLENDLKYKTYYKLSELPGQFKTPVQTALNTERPLDQILRTPHTTKKDSPKPLVKSVGFHKRQNKHISVKTPSFPNRVDAVKHFPLRRLKHLAKSKNDKELAQIDQFQEVSEGNDPEVKLEVTPKQEQLNLTFSEYFCVSVRDFESQKEEQVSSLDNCPVTPTATPVSSPPPIITIPTASHLTEKQGQSQTGCHLTTSNSSQFAAYNDLTHTTKGSDAIRTGVATDNHRKYYIAENKAELDTTCGCEVCISSRARDHSNVEHAELSVNDRMGLNEAQPIYISSDKPGHTAPILGYYQYPSQDMGEGTGILNGVSTLPGKKREKRVVQFSVENTVHEYLPWKPIKQQLNISAGET